MIATRALVLEPDHEVRRQIDQAIRSASLQTVASETLSEAITRAEESPVAVVIADFDALSGTQRTAAYSKSAAGLRKSILQLRQSQAERPVGEASPRHLAVIVTSPRETVAAHAAALTAGADLFLSVAEARNETILGSYLARLLREPGSADSEVNRALPQEVDTPAAEVPRIAEAFSLPTGSLRGESGRLHATRIAEMANLPLRALAAVIGVKYGTLHKTPDAPAVQSKLAPFANVLAMLDQVYGGDQRRIRAWIDTPKAELSNRSPKEVLLEPGGIRGVEQFVSGAWLGVPQ